MATIYDLFLSHNSEDKPAILEIAKLLRRRRFKPWVDVERLTPGRHWQDEAEEVIRTCRAAAVFVGQSGIGPWEHEEMRACLTQAVRRSLPVIPVLLPGAPKKPDLPLFLGERTWVDLMSGVTSEGLDALVWGITGKKPKRKAQPRSRAADPGPPLHNLPFPPLGDLFKGRDLELQALAKSLEANGKPSAILQSEAIHGLGGIGKTSLAVEYAWRFGSRYTAVFFIHAESPEALRTELADLARADLLDLPERHSKDENETGAAVRKWLKGNPGWLLILDNVDTEEAELAVVRLLPALTGGHVLITSRRPSWPHEVHTQSLDKISREEGRDFLLKRTEGRRRPAGDDSAWAERLAERLDGLPLALEQAAAYINRTRLSFSDYLEAWEHDRERVMVWYDEAVMRYPFPVAMTWQRSFDQLKPTAAALLRLTAFLATEPIPEEMFRHEKDVVRKATELLCAETGQEVDGSSIDEALADLEGYSLISRQGTTFTIHRVVQEVVQSRIPVERRRDWIAAALEIVNNYSPATPNDVRTWAVWDVLRPHAKLVAMLADEADITQPTAWLLTLLAILLQEKGLYPESELLMRRALAIDEASYGNEHPTVARGLNNLASLLKDTNRLSEAEPLMRKALSIIEMSFGGEHLLVATCLNNLASLLKDTNRLPEAEPLMRRALAIDEASYENDHPAVATQLNNLALLLQTTNRLSEAEPLMRRALAINEASYGNDHPAVAIQLNNLALLLQDTNRFSEAEPLMRRALAINEASYGSEHASVAICLNSLATLLYGIGRFSEAEALMRRALAITEAFYGNEHPAVAIKLNNLATLLQATNRLFEAEPLMRRALAIDEASYGNEHPAVAIGLNNLAQLLQATNRPSEAEPLMRRTLAIDEASYGSEHPTVAIGLNNLAQLLQATNRPSEAEPLIRLAVEIYGRSLGLNHPTTRNAQLSLAVLLEKIAGQPTPPDHP